MDPAVVTPAETDRIDPVAEPFALSTGFRMRLVPLKTRQLFRLMRILTHGGGAALLSSSFDLAGDPEQFAGKLVALVVLAIPDAEDEAIAFIASMAEPESLVRPRRGEVLSKEVKAANQGAWDALNEELFNPSPADTLDVIERIVRAEAADLQALAGKVTSLLGMLRQQAPPVSTQQAPAPPSAPDGTPPASSAPSVTPSMPSAPSTDGQTSESLTSPSGGSARSEPPSVLAGQPAMPVPAS